MASEALDLVAMDDELMDNATRPSTETAPLLHCENLVKRFGDNTGYASVDDGGGAAGLADQTITD